MRQGVLGLPHPAPLAAAQQQEADRRWDQPPTCHMPLASTGGSRAIQHLRPYLSHPRAALRSCAIRALAVIGTGEALEVLRTHLTKERDERLRSELARFIQVIQKGRHLPDVLTDDASAGRSSENARL